MELLKAFLQYIIVEKRYSKLTAQAYERDLEQFFVFINTTFDIQNFQDVKHTHIRSWLASLMQNNNNAARSVNRKISTLKSFYKYLLRQNVISSLPTTKITTPKNSKRLPSFISESSMELLLDTKDFGTTFKDKTERLIIEMLYNTGMRRAELVALSVTQIDFSNALIKILGKGNKERLMPIVPELQTLIKDYLNERTLLGFARVNQLLVTPKGEPVYEKFVYNAVKKHLATVTTQNKKSPHVLRHSFATHILNNGAQLNAVKELLGHANLAATQVYTHNTIDKLKNAFNKAHPKA